MGLFRRRFSDLVGRQLDLFEADNRPELGALAAARDEVRQADADDAAGTFGDYQDRVDWAAQDLIALRATYAATLDEETAAAYERAFARAVRRRFPALADAVASEDVG